VCLALQNLPFPTPCICSLVSNITKEHTAIGMYNFRCDISSIMAQLELPVGDIPFPSSLTKNKNYTLILIITIVIIVICIIVIIVVVAVVVIVIIKTVASAAAIVSHSMSFLVDSGASVVVAASPVRSAAASAKGSPRPLKAAGDKS